MSETVEYVLRLHDNDQRSDSSSGVSVRQCPRCFALVVEDLMPDHGRWHERLGGRMSAADSGIGFMGVFGGEEGSI